MNKLTRNVLIGSIYGGILLSAAACDVFGTPNLAPLTEAVQALQTEVAQASPPETAAPVYQTAEPAAIVVPDVSPGLEQAVEDTILVCSFNIQNLGPSKMDKPEVMAVLADILAQCDITAIQEVSDKSQQVMAALVYDTMNGSAKYDATYDFELSPRIGLNRSSSNAEQYAFVFNADKIKVVRRDGQKLTYVFPDGDSGSGDIFAREPYVMEFEVIRYTKPLAQDEHALTFALATVHTKPTDAQKEICALTNVIDDTQGRFDEGDVFVLGDFNGDNTKDKYFNENQDSAACALKDQIYNWFIGNSIDTTVSTNNDYTYDRIVAKHQFTDEDFTGKAGVFYYNQEQPADSPFIQVPTILETKDYSDHYPVWLMLYANRDTD